MRNVIAKVILLGGIGSSACVGKEAREEIMLRKVQNQMADAVSAAKKRHVLRA